MDLVGRLILVAGLEREDYMSLKRGGEDDYKACIDATGIGEDFFNYWCEEYQGISCYGTVNVYKELLARYVSKNCELPVAELAKRTGETEQSIRATACSAMLYDLCGCDECEIASKVATARKRSRRS